MTGWPDLPNMDYRHGFPMPPISADIIDQLPDLQRVEILRRLERATFEALTRLDIADAETWLATATPDEEWRQEVLFGWINPVRHAHGPLKTPFCRQCREHKRAGNHYVGRLPNGQRMYAGPPVDEL